MKSRMGDSYIDDAITAVRDDGDDDKMMMVVIHDDDDDDDTGDEDVSLSSTYS